MAQDKDAQDFALRDLLALAQAAEQAAPGRWHVGMPGGSAGPFWSLLNPRGNVVAMQVTSDRLAVYMAEVSPEVITALLERLQRAEAENAQMRAALEKVARQPCTGWGPVDEPTCGGKDPDCLSCLARRALSALSEDGGVGGGNEGE